MRGEVEIQEMRDALDSGVVSKIYGDTFRCGYLIGKLEALAWVLSEARSGELQIEHDFESFRLETKAPADEWREREEGDEVE